MSEPQNVNKALYKMDAQKQISLIIKACFVREQDQTQIIFGVILDINIQGKLLPSS